MAVMSEELKRLGFGNWCCDGCAEKAFFDYRCPNYGVKQDSSEELGTHRQECAVTRADDNA